MSDEDSYLAELRQVLSPLLASPGWTKPPTKVGRDEQRYDLDRAEALIEIVQAGVAAIVGAHQRALGSPAKASADALDEFLGQLSERFIDARQPAERPRARALLARINSLMDTFGAAGVRQGSPGTLHPSERAQHQPKAEAGVRLGRTPTQTLRANDESATAGELEERVERLARDARALHRQREELMADIQVQEGIIQGKSAGGGHDHLAAADRVTQQATLSRLQRVVGAVVVAVEETLGRDVRNAGLGECLCADPLVQLLKEESEEVLVTLLDVPAAEGGAGGAAALGAAVDRAVDKAGAALFGS